MITFKSQKSLSIAVICLLFALLPVSWLFAASSSGIKGVNNPHVWWDSQSWTALDAIKSNGFNAVRIVWQTSGTAARLNEIIQRCKTLGLKPIPELHDITGGTNAADLDRMATWFITNKSVVPSDVWVNIANEWGDANGTGWRDAYKAAVTKMRNAGMTNTIVIDAPGWGQDNVQIKNYGIEMLNADPQKNLMFSIHFYGSWNDKNKITTELTAIKNAGIPIMVGEFGYNYNNGGNNLNCMVDAAHVMTTCKNLGLGYLAWSWCGNDSSNAWLDMTTNWGALNTWGNLVKAGGGSVATTTPTATTTIVTRTATRTATGSTRTATRTATTGGATPTRTATGTTTTPPATGCTCRANCTTRATITIPFVKDGAGEFCWEATSIGSYINSWNVDILEINGKACTNLWVSASSIAPIGGKYYIYMKASLSYAHVEIK